MSKALPEPAVLDATVRLLSAIAHPTRLAVLVALGREGPMAVGDLVTLTGVEQSAMSHQLRTLKTARLVVAQQDGKRRVYSLHDHHIKHIIEDALAHVVEEPD